MYYRVAIQTNSSSTWQWKSTTISSLNALFQFLRRYQKLPQDQLRIFSSACSEDMDEQLARENNGLGSRSVTAARFMQERMIGSQSRTAVADAPTSNESSDGMYPARESISTGRAVAAGAEWKIASRGDFWNLMTLARA